MDMLNLYIAINIISGAIGGIVSVIALVVIVRTLIKELW